MLRSLRPPRLPDDLRVELTTLLFASLQTFAITAVPTSAVVVAAYVARSTGTMAAYELVGATLAAVVSRVGVIQSHRFRADPLTPTTAKRWAAAYGASALAIAGCMAIVTTGALEQGGTLAYAPLAWCIATALGITARTSTVPWIPVTTSSVLLLPVALAAFLRPEVEFWLMGGLVLLVLFSVYDCVDHAYRSCVERLLAKREAARIAQTDVLTGLANRLVIRSALSAACAGSEAFALLYVDLDGFKAVNDGHGHAVGDLLLMEAAARIRRVADNAVTARIGGDEFGVLQPANGVPAAALASLIVEHLSLPYYIDGRVLRIGASVGVAFGTGTADEPASLFQEADEALYRAKAAGKGQWRAGPERDVA